MRVTVLIVLAVFAASLATLANVLHYGIKRILRQRGYPVNLLHGHFRDIGFFREAIANEKDPVTKLRYRKVLYALFASVVLFLVSALLFLDATN